jgi:hypothetical protein
MIPAQSVNNISVGSQRRIKHTFTQHIRHHRLCERTQTTKREKREGRRWREAKGET